MAKFTELHVSLYSDGHLIIAKSKKAFDTAIAKLDKSLFPICRRLNMNQLHRVINRLDDCDSHAMAIVRAQLSSSQYYLLVSGNGPNCHQIFAYGEPSAKFDWATSWTEDAGLGDFPSEWLGDFAALTPGTLPYWVNMMAVSSAKRLLASLPALADVERPARVERYIELVIDLLSETIVRPDTIDIADGDDNSLIRPLATYLVLGELFEHYDGASVVIQSEWLNHWDWIDIKGF